MNKFNFDDGLSGYLKPLANLGATFILPPFVNTLCAGYHYDLALSSGNDKGIIEIGAWEELSEEKIIGHLKNMVPIITYMSKSGAEELEKKCATSRKINVHSMPITRYCPRYAFVPNNDVFALMVKETRGVLSRGFMKRAIDDGRPPVVYSDIMHQAKALFESLCELPTGKIDSDVTVISENTWLNKKRPDNCVPLFLYGAPCVSYMRRRRESYLPLEINFSDVSNMPEFETHVLWLVLRSRKIDNSVIRNALSNYHKALFERAVDVKDDEIEGLRNACNNILSNRHPCFPREIFADAISFKECLVFHHEKPIEM